MMSQFTNADVVVLGLIGERAREVGVMVQSLFSNENKQILSSGKKSIKIVGTHFQGNAKFLINLLNFSSFPTILFGINTSTP